MAKAELRIGYGCPVCDEICNTESRAEIHCELDPPREVLVCSVCEEDFDNTKRGQVEANDHLLTHGIDADGFSAEERYLEALRFGKPPLGEWVETMKAEVEFLIP